MKLLLVSESYWPNVDGGAAFQRRLVHGLIDRGHTVAVWAPSRSFRSHVQQDGKSTIYRERSFPLPYNKPYRASLWPFWHAFSVIRRERPNVIHIHAPTQIGLAALIAARIHHIPVVATNHVMPENLLTPALPGWLFKFTATMIWRYIIFFHNRVAAVTAPSPTALSYLQQHHLKPPAKAISNGLNLSFFYPPAIPPRNNPPVLLYLGRLDGEKNVKAIISAAGMLASQVDFKLVLVGRGNQTLGLKHFAIKLGLADRVEFRGWVSEAEKRNILQNADIFVIMSSAELQSIVTLEAMACAKPVIAANAGALPDLVKDRVNGYLVPHDDAAKLAKRCLTLINSAELRRTFGQASLKLIQSRHSTEATFTEYEKIYRYVLRAKK